MLPETSEALNKSIIHWRENLSARASFEADISSHSCALCKLFIYDNCLGCPVSSRTGKTRCLGSPYERARDTLNEWGRLSYAATRDDGTIHTWRSFSNIDWLKMEAEWQNACRDEISFLESLRVPYEVVEKTCGDPTITEVGSSVEKSTSRPVDPCYDGSYF
jgi:hypothetical protein